MATLRAPSSRRGRVALVGAGILVTLAVIAQVVLPGHGEGVIEDRLTRGGGTADVSLSAIPAMRLLWGDGDRLELEGRDLDLNLASEGVAFDNLDPFGSVNLELADSSIGPIALDELTIERDGSEPYEITLTGATTLAELTAAAAVPGAGLLGTFLGGTDLGDRPLALDLDMGIASEDGEIDVVRGGARIDGVPTGPLAEIIVAAIAVQL